MKKNTPWPRVIILIDMNSFFAAVEQWDFPELRNRPIAVTNGMDGSCIITSSYEARAFGIKTGMRLHEAKHLCPSLIQCPSRPDRYAKISAAIMNSLHAITPDIEIFSIDEAFLDVTRCQKLLGTPEDMAKLIRKAIHAIAPLPCSIGVSGDKTTAKYAAKLKKPNGLTIIPPWQAKEALKNISVTELCGIGEGITRFLAAYGVRTCGDMKRIPIGILAKRFGNLGRRLWYMCQGEDPMPLQLSVPEPKSMGHGKVIPPNTTDPHTVQTYLLHMSEKLSARLRRHQMQAQHFYIGVRCNFRWQGTKAKLAYPTNDGSVIKDLCSKVLKDHWRGEPLHQVQVTALDPTSLNSQLDFFQESTDNRDKINQLIDNINSRYGEFAIAPAQLLLRSKMPNVISPAWKPVGHRQTI